jgi:hypothetical protein
VAGGIDEEGRTIGLMPQSIERRMAIVQRFTTIDEAIQFALDGQKEGRWDLFRGETNAARKVTTSLERRKDAAYEEALRRMNEFNEWAKQQMLMAPYHGNADAIIAIAQHYGLATPFLDLTDNPRVAGFFACDTRKTPPHDQEATIICINSADFMDFVNGQFAFMVRKAEPEAPLPEFLRINVDNLWRLQQQQGSFLWNPHHDFEAWYDFDRIVFPYTRDGQLVPRRSAIYPEDQSPLEQTLTQFFMNERLREGNAAIQTRLKGRAVHFEVDVTEAYESSSWSNGDLASSQDWDQALIWSIPKVEHASDALPGYQVPVDPKKPLPEIVQDLKTFVGRLDISETRDAALYFPEQNGPFANHYPRISAALRRLWNGMRVLPYTDDEIRFALLRTLEWLPDAIEQGGMSGATPDGYVPIDLAVELTGKGPYSNALVSLTGLCEAYNPNFITAAERKLNEALANHEYGGISLPARPRERFTFTGLRKLMVEEVIPSQVSKRILSDGQQGLETYIAFSPAELNVIGLS